MQTAKFGYANANTLKRHPIAMARTKRLAMPKCKQDPSVSVDANEMSIPSNTLEEPTVEAIHQLARGRTH